MLSTIAIIPSARVLVPELAGAVVAQVAEARAAMVAAVAGVPGRRRVKRLGRPRRRPGQTRQHTKGHPNYHLLGQPGQRGQVAATQRIIQGPPNADVGGAVAARGGGGQGVGTIGDHQHARRLDRPVGLRVQLPAELQRRLGIVVSGVHPDLGASVRLSLIPHPSGDQREERQLDRLAACPWRETYPQIGAETGEGPHTVPAEHRVRGPDPDDHPARRPTGVGKSQLALDVAERLGGEIVNASAMLSVSEKLPQYGDFVGLCAARDLGEHRAGTLGGGWPIRAAPRR